MPQNAPDLTVEEIEAARMNAVHDADAQVVEAIARRNGSHSQTTRDKLNDLIDTLMAARTNLSALAVEAMANSSAVQLLKVLGAATTEMKRVAEHEKTLAQFMRLAASFATAGSQSRRQRSLARSSKAKQRYQRDKACA